MWCCLLIGFWYRILKARSLWTYFLLLWEESLKMKKKNRRATHRTNFARGNAYLSHILCPLFQLCSSWIGYKVAHGCQPFMTEDLYWRNNMEIAFSLVNAFLLSPEPFICTNLNSRKIIAFGQTSGLSIEWNLSMQQQEGSISYVC